MSEDTRSKDSKYETNSSHMGEGRHQDSLRRLRKRIADGLDLCAFDSTTTGDKYTQCSWGLCSPDKEQWPDKFDHLWPLHFEKYGRVAPRYRQKGQMCPIDLRAGAKEGKYDKLAMMQGCFFTCRIFETVSGNSPSRDVVLILFDEEIARRERDFGHKTTEDDDEWRD